ncbi:hypothetical protein [Lacticaseibacillus rhamnosus]|nr:hypothetical protein [Lacticaseibacillus rhamnosus]MCI9807576.1 hypothetical protein [Lacticaseibacillus rhamnosus]MDM7524558.1 hypothetical protein [Lacticaseibacillus rhamnosus]UTX31970.1 hypothetical protein NNM43_12990 [Lacticaseibacillus rhamnosus]
MTDQIPNQSKIDVGSTEPNSSISGKMGWRLEARAVMALLTRKDRDFKVS